MGMRYEDFIISSGRIIRYERAKKGFSQEGLAQESRMHRNHLGSIERGERNVSVHNLLRIAGALRLPLSALIEQAEELAESEAPRT